MYPFSISVDEHVPLDMGAGRNFSRDGPIVDFPGVGKNILQGAKSGKITFHHSKKTTFFCKIFDEKLSTFKILRDLVPSSDAHAPKTSYQ